MYVYITYVCVYTYICVCYVYFSCGSDGKESIYLQCMRPTQVQSLGWEDPLEKEMATHSSILA